MPLFFFHQHLNGRLEKDRRGRRFPSVDDARVYWPNVTPLMIAQGQRVAIEMMHLHGHAFQVVSVNGAQLAGAVRDTVLVPPMGSVTIAFDADNPGRWAFHCHNLYHMMTGMMTEVRYPAII